LHFVFRGFDRRSTCIGGVTQSITRLRVVLAQSSCSSRAMLSHQDDLQCISLEWWTCSKARNSPKGLEILMLQKAMAVSDVQVGRESAPRLIAKHGQTTLYAITAENASLVSCGNKLCQIKNVVRGSWAHRVRHTRRLEIYNTDWRFVYRPAMMSQSHPGKHARASTIRWNICCNNYHKDQTLMSSSLAPF
jgi:hypothetical protein